MNFTRNRKLWVLLATVCLAGGLVTFAISAQQQPPAPPAGYGPPPPAQGYGPPPPPPPAYGTMTSVSGAITQFNYGPNAQPESFMLNRNTIVHFPPDLGCAISGMVMVGDTVKVDGLANTNYYGTQSLELQDLNDSTSGRQFSVSQPWSATAYSGSGTIRQLNYGPQGEINGFWLNNNILVHIPPMAPSSSLALQVGAAAAVSGYAHRTISNKTAVDASSLTVNGQTIPIYAAPPPPPAPGAALPPAPPAQGAAPPPPPGP